MVPASVPASAFGPYRDDFRLFDQSANIIFVPEPATPLLMTAGIGGLALLARVRGRRRGRP
jgi:hypothetical protein